MGLRVPEESLRIPLWEASSLEARQPRVKFTAGKLFLQRCTFHFTRSPTVSHFSLYTIFHCFTLFSIFKFSVGWQAASAAGHQVAHERREQRWKNLAPTHYGRGWETSVAFFIHRRRDDRCIGAFFITCIASNVTLFFQKSDRDLFGGMISQLHRCDNLALFSGQCWMCINSVRGI